MFYTVLRVHFWLLGSSLDPTNALNYTRLSSTAYPMDIDKHSQICQEQCLSYCHFYLENFSV